MRSFGFLVLLCLCSLLALSAGGCREKRPAQQTATARAALEAIGKVANAADYQRGYEAYATLTFKTKERVDTLSRSLPDDELSKEITGAMAAYYDAAVAWESMNYRRFQDWYILVHRYSVTSDTGSSLNQEEVLKTIWATARKRYDRAAALLG